MEWIAHKGWQELGALPNSPQALIDGTATDFRLEFDLFWDGERVLVAHDKETRTGFLFEEALEIVSGAANTLSLDIKNRGGEEHIARALRGFPDPERILLCGHDRESLQAITGPFRRGWSPVGSLEEIERVLLGSQPGQLCDGFMLHYDLARDPLVTQIKEWGGWVHAWTLDELWQTERLGPVDGITSNRPEALKSALGL